MEENKEKVEQTTTETPIETPTTTDEPVTLSEEIVPTSIVKEEVIDTAKEEKLAEEKKLNRNPLFLGILVIVLIFGGILGYTIFFKDNKQELPPSPTDLGSKEKKEQHEVITSDKKEEKKEKETVKEEPKEKEPEKVEEPKEEKEPEIKREVVNKTIDNITKEITLNGETYELKIEVLLYELLDNSIETYRQNIYLNNIKVLSEIDIFSPNPSMAKEGNGYYKESVPNELKNIKIIKDTKNDEEYLVFTDDTGQVHFSKTHYYIISKQGKLMKKIAKKMASSSLNILSNKQEPEGVFSINQYNNSSDEQQNYNYVYRGEPIINKDSIIYVHDWREGTKSANSIDMDDYTCYVDDMEEFTINKITIANGEVSDEKYYTFKKTDDYAFKGAGGCIPW